MSSNNPIYPSTPKDHRSHYYSGSDDEDAIYGPKKGYSVLGEFFDRGLHKQAEDTTYYKQIVQKRYEYAGEYLKNSEEKMNGETFNKALNSVTKNIKDACDSEMNSSNYVGEAAEKSAKSVLNSNKTIKETCDFITKTLTEILELVKGTTQKQEDKEEKKEEKQEEILEQVLENSSKSKSSDEDEDDEDDEDDGTKLTNKTLQQFVKSWGTEQSHMRTNEAVLAIALEQIINVANKIEKEVREGRHQAAEIYNQNASEVLSRGVTDKTSYMLKTADISNELLENGLYANLNTNEIYKGYTELVKKGYSDEDATEMAMEDAIESKIAPYLDTTSTAFKDLQNKFGDQFLNKITGINNYIQEIAGSAKVWESNANTIISSLEPIQLWAEQQNWGEEEMAALEYLTEEGGMTQTEASQLIQEALKVSTDQYGSVTGGTIAQKVAVATGQTDFGDAITSLLGTSNIVSNSNQLVQGAGLSALGVKGFTAENADLETRWSTYQKGLSNAKASETSPEAEATNSLADLIKGNYTTTKEAEANITQNTGSTFALLEEMFPTAIETLDSMLSVDKLISTITTVIAIRQGRALTDNALSSITGGGESGSGGLLSSIGSKISGSKIGSTLSSVGSKIAGSKVGTALSSVGSKIAGSLGTVAGSASIGSLAGPLAAAAAGSVLPVIAGLGITQLVANNRNENDTREIYSYDVGSDYIKNDQLAYIHKGEAVLTPDENKEYQSNKKATKKLSEGNIQIQVEQEEKNDKLIAEVKALKNDLIETIKYYNKKEKTYTYNSNVVNLSNENET